MSAITSRRAVARWGFPLVGVLLVGACGGSTATSSPTATTSSSVATSSAVTTTATTSSGPLTADELVWLQGIGTLQKKMTKAVVEMPTNMTPASARAVADKLRACTPELAKLGAPTARLQPVKQLAQKGCATLAEAATSFAKVATINVAAPGAAEKISKQLDLAVAATEKGLQLLANAQMKAYEIQTANQ